MHFYLKERVIVKSIILFFVRENENLYFFVYKYGIIKNVKQNSKVGDKMLMDELKCIEVLLRNIVRNSNLKAEIMSEFSEEETFEEHKKNLFNLISIDNLIANFSENVPFSLESFLKTGIIPNMYEERTATPFIESDFKGDYRDFYNSLLTALKENNYVFDKDNNIHISTSSIEATIPQVWLYRLAAASKRNTYERVYFYKKTDIANIPNKKALIDYLRQTKTFIAELTTSNPNADYEMDFLSAQSMVKGKLANQQEVKVEQVIRYFKESMPQTYNIEISKYKLADEFWLLKKVDAMGSSFYSEPIEIQESLLNKWILERTMSNEIASQETQKYILLANLEGTHDYEKNPSRKESVIVGLFNLYISLLNQLTIDVADISFRDFKVKAYLDEQTEENKVFHRETNLLIEKEEDLLARITQEITQILRDIEQLDIIRDFDIINQKREKYNQLVSIYEEHEKKRKAFYNQNNAIGEAIETPIEDPTFDNGTIMSKITEATKKGRVYVNGNHLVMELHNHSFSEPVFSASIAIDQLLEWIENINFGFEEYKIKIG